MPGRISVTVIGLALNCHVYRRGGGKGVDLLQSLIALGLVALVAGLGAYFGSYLKTKGKNLATHEDIDKVLVEVRATTQATKEIEARISDNVWDRQKRWEMKRDVLFEMARKASLEIGAMNGLKAVYTTEKINVEKGLPARLEKRLGVGARWNDAAAEFEGMQILVAASCGIELVKSIGEFGLFMRNLSLEIVKLKPEAFDAALPEMARKAHAISLAIRKELEIR